jgi:hypothetical protein
MGSHAATYADKLRRAKKAQSLPASGGVPSGFFMNENMLTKKIVDAAYQVHWKVGIRLIEFWGLPYTARNNLCSKRS